MKRLCTHVYASLHHTAEKWRHLPETKEQHAVNLIISVGSIQEVLCSVYRKFFVFMGPVSKAQVKVV
jgi:hypothetical protein